MSPTIKNFGIPGSLVLQAFTSCLPIFFSSLSIWKGCPGHAFFSSFKNQIFWQTVLWISSAFSTSLFYSICSTASSIALGLPITKLSSTYIATYTTPLHCFWYNGMGQHCLCWILPSSKFSKPFYHTVLLLAQVHRFTCPGWSSHLFQCLSY